MMKKTMTQQTIWNHWFKMMMCCILVCTLNTMISTAQNAGATVQGIVTDTKGVPLVGVNVVEKGTTNGVITDTNGKFTLHTAKAATLTISYIGYLTQNIIANNQTKLRVKMQDDQELLGEVVVLGYGTQKKGDVTSAVTKVDSKDFVKGSVRDVGQLLQGKVAGLAITTPSGDPSATTQIKLRGIGSLKGSSNPLILIDGVPGDLNTVAPEDVESMDVLKDGSAAAIYGARGSNGVIIITTRRSKGEMKPTIELTSYLSTQSIYKKADFMDAGDYRRLISEGNTRLSDLGSSTDWLKEITRTPFSQVYNVSIKGGTSNTNYIVNANVKKNQGIFLKSDYDKASVRANIIHTMYDGKFKIEANLFNSISNIGSFNNYIYRQAVIRNPTDQIKDANGNWQERANMEYINPVAALNEMSQENRFKEMRWNSSITYTPIQDLHLKAMGSTTNTDRITGYSETKENASNTQYQKNGTANRGSDFYTENLLELTADYKYNLGKSKYSILGGYSYLDRMGEGMNAYNYDFPSDIYTYNNIGNGVALAQGKATMGSYKSSSKMAAFFGRFTYNYDDRYLLLVSIRQEGSSKFGANNKWGTFPAISMGWRISNEKFMKDYKFINDLKLRVGYGVTGTEPNDNYISMARLQYSGNTYMNGGWIPQITPASNPNPDLSWEEKHETNIGVDYALWDSRISGTIDLYKRDTKKMLWDYSVPVPPYLYGQITANVGDIQNKGMEVLLNIVPIKMKDFQWTTSFNYSTNRNRLISLSNSIYKTSNDYIDEGYTGPPIQQSTHRIQIGGPIGNFYGYKAIDIDKDGQWIFEGKDGKPVKYDAKSEADKQVLGNGLPKWYAGWNNSFTYKQFDLNISMRGAFGFQILNIQRMNYENPIQPLNVLRSAYNLVYGKAVLASPLEYTSYYIENGTYWKIDNVNLGYTFKLKETCIIKNLRLSVSGLNLLTITGYKGMDPEVNTSGLSPGIDDRDKYPTTRTFTFGAHLTF